MIDLTQCAVGVDLGDRKSLGCVYALGTVMAWFEFEMTPEGVREAFEGKGYAKVAMEAGAQSGWVTRLLRTLGYAPMVANPRKLKAISANERKSDRNDALLLAKLVGADASLLHPIEHRSEERALALTVLGARDAAVGGRTRLINTIRSMAKGMGHRLKRGSAEGFVHRAAEVPAALAPAVTGLFAVLGTLNEQIAAYDAQLERMVEETFPEAQRPKQIRGVGPVTALAFVLTLEDAKRFPNGRTAAAFLGLAPKRDQSGSIDRQLGISKTGSNLVRRLLVHCAQYILGPLGRDCDLRRWGHALAARGGRNGKKRAIVATARRLAVLMFRLWKSGDPWEPLHNVTAAEKRAAPAVPVAADTSVSGGATLQDTLFNVCSDVERPEPAVADDCASFLESAGNRPSRGIDCSAADSLDPSMHRATSGPSSSADRSVGNRTTAKTNPPVKAGAPGRKPKSGPTTTHATADGDRGGPLPGVGVAPAPGSGATRPARPPAPMEAPETGPALRSTHRRGGAPAPTRKPSRSGRIPDPAP